jgi:predicted adenylyl cyclase CyaB
MGRNIEIKAKSRNFERQTERAKSLSTARPEHLVQEDTFFVIPAGRLKLRKLGDGSGELIQYDREDSAGPKESRYTVLRTRDPEGLKAVLAKALGVRAVVRKKRTVYFSGQTRIHLDQVAGLGEFIELEVVLEPDQDIQYGTSMAEDLMAKLEIAKGDLVTGAYIDLLNQGAEHD